MSIFSSLFSWKRRSSSPSHKDYVLLCALFDTYIELTVYAKEGGSLSPVESKRKTLTHGYEGVVDDCELALAPLEKSLGAEMKDVLFIVPSYGIDDVKAEVMQPYRRAVSEIVKAFEFSPLGYVDTFEIIKPHIQNYDHWIFLERSAQIAHLILCQGQTVKRRLRVTSDPDEICAHIEESATKKAHIIYVATSPSEDLSEFHKNLIGYSWETLTRDVVLQHVQKALEEQLFGVASIDSPAEAISPPVVPDIPLDQETVSHDVVHVETVAAVVAEPVTTPARETPPVSVAMPLDNSPMIAETVPSSDTESSFETTTPVDTIDDFVIYKDESDAQSMNTSDYSTAVSYVTSDASAAAEPNTPSPVIHEAETVEEEVESKVTQARKPFRLPLPSFSFMPMKSALSMIVAAIFAVSLAIGCGFEFFYHTADIALVAKTSPYATELTLNNFPITKELSQKEIMARVAATGDKEVGERAKGNVILASFDDKVATFSAGTKLLVGEKVYKLDTDAVLEPASVNVSQGTKVASKKNVAASATFIGPDGNMEKGKELVVDGFAKSQYYAVSDSAFTGGTKQAVTAVAAIDVDKLDTRLNLQAQTASKEALMSRSHNRIIVPTLSSTTLDKIEYTASVGDAAEEIRADGIASSTLYAVDKQDLVDRVKEMIIAEKGSSFLFDAEQLTFTVSKAQLNSKETTANLRVNVDAHIYPKISLDGLAGRTFARPISMAERELQAGRDLERIEIRQSPAFPPFTWFLPLTQSRIQFTLVPAESK